VAWYSRITIGNDTFKTGDRRIISLDLTLSENARGSTCSFEIYDPGLAIAGRYFLASYETGGIQVPSDLLQAPQPPTAIATAATIAGGGANGSTANRELSPSMRAILDMIAYAEGADYNVIFSGVTFDDFSDHPRQLINSGGYSSDAAGRYQFLSTTWDTLGLPDFSPENQDKGCVMLIDRRGVLAEAEAGDLPGFLDQASYEWASLPPSRYGQPQKTLEELQGVYDAALARYQGGGATTTPPPAPPPIVDDAKPSTAEQLEQAELPEVADPTPSPKGTEIIIELGVHPQQLLSWHFIHTGTTASGRSPDTTKFEGKCIRWKISRRNINATWENITLRELAEVVAESFGCELLMEGSGPTYAAIDATGISLYALLLRECKAIGYRVYDEGNTLIVEPYRPQFTGFVITRQILIGMPSSVDRATGDSYQSTTPEPANPATPDEQAGETVAEIDPLTGEIKQVAPENSAGVGDLEIAALTGNAAPPVHGVVAANPQGESAATNIAAQIAAEVIPGNPLPTYRGILPENVTGLPTQQIGAIDLADGTAEAEAIADESRRVMSYETQIEIKTTPASLTLVPGQIVAIAEDCFDNRTARDAWCKEWRISQIRRSFKGGSIATTLSLYTPQAQKPPQPQASSGGAASGGATAVNVDLKPGELIWPMKLEGNSVAGMTCEFGNERGRRHAGIDFGGYGAGSDRDLVFASGQGVVTTARQENGPDGYGRMAIIQHANGIETLYGHLASLVVSEGQEVQQGQPIGQRGASGFFSEEAYEIHLHFETIVNGEPVDPRTVIARPGPVQIATGDDNPRGNAK